uniref:Uncharacterized protein n=1 Tax=viral metagenome TaxID=1070528 RepID=A0A6H1Z8B0_9ZZZZ
MAETTLWNNIKGRVQYLKKHTVLMGEGAEWALAICEELERLDHRIEKLERRLIPEKTGRVDEEI